MPRYLPNHCKQMQFRFWSLHFASLRLRWIRSDQSNGKISWTSQYPPIATHNSICDRLERTSFGNQDFLIRLLVQLPLLCVWTNWKQKYSDQWKHEITYVFFIDSPPLCISRQFLYFCFEIMPTRPAAQILVPGIKASESNYCFGFTQRISTALLDTDYRQKLILER